MSLVHDTRNLKINIRFKNPVLVFKTELAKFFSMAGVDQFLKPGLIKDIHWENKQGKYI